MWGHVVRRVIVSAAGGGAQTERAEAEQMCVL